MAGSPYPFNPPPAPRPAPHLAPSPIIIQSIPSILHPNTVRLTGLAPAAELLPPGQTSYSMLLLRSPPGAPAYNYVPPEKSINVGKSMPEPPSQPAPGGSQPSPGRSLTAIPSTSVYSAQTAWLSAQDETTRNHWKYMTLQSDLSAHAPAATDADSSSSALAVSTGADSSACVLAASMGSDSSPPAWVASTDADSSAHALAASMGSDSSAHAPAASKDADSSSHALAASMDSDSSAHAPAASTDADSAACKAPAWRSSSMENKEHVLLLPEVYTGVHAVLRPWSLPPSQLPPLLALLKAAGSTLSRAFPWAREPELSWFDPSWEDPPWAKHPFPEREHEELSEEVPEESLEMIPEELLEEATQVEASSRRKVTFYFGEKSPATLHLSDAPTLMDSAMQSLDPCKLSISPTESSSSSEQSPIRSPSRRMVLNVGNFQFVQAGGCQAMEDGSQTREGGRSPMAKVGTTSSRHKPQPKVQAVAPPTPKPSPQHPNLLRQLTSCVQARRHLRRKQVDASILSESNRVLLRPPMARLI